MNSSIRQRSMGTWQLTVDLGHDTSGRRRKWLTVRGIKAQANRRLGEQVGASGVKTMMYASTAVLLAVLTLGIACSNEPNLSGPSEYAEVSSAYPPTSTPIPTPTLPPSAGHFIVDVDLLDNGGRGPYQFSPAVLRFAAGDVVTFSLTPESVYHTFTIDGLNLDLDVDVGSPTLAAFSFDEPGTYDLICIAHELYGMVGTVVVEP